MQQEKVGLMTRLKNSWDVFRSRDPTWGVGPNDPYSFGYLSTYRPDRLPLQGGVDKTVITAIKNRIAIDVSSVPMKHVRRQNGRYSEDIKSGLNNVLTVEANIDQSGRAFMQDIVMSMLDEGVVAVIPVETDVNPIDTSSFDIKTMRVGRITQWFPQHITVDLYNEFLGIRQEVTVPKHMAAIIENPLYATMNEPNSILQKLLRRLNLLDVVDEQASSGKLDIIIQFPYSIRTEQMRNLANSRRIELEKQLSQSKYGIGYADGTERITQLNRPAENNLMSSIDYLTNMLHSQLGTTPGVFDGTASEQEMLNYWKRTIEPILSAIRSELDRKFVTKTGRAQGQAIMFFNQPFMLVPAEQMAELADKLTRNEILTPNEFRAELGYAPAEDPKANELRNRNIAEPKTNETVTEDIVVKKGGNSQNGTKTPKV